MMFKLRPEIITIPELAEYLRVDETLIKAHLGIIPHIRLGEEVRFRKKTIMQWLDRIEYRPERSWSRHDFEISSDIFKEIKIEQE